MTCCSVAFNASPFENVWFLQNNKCTGESPPLALPFFDDVAAPHVSSQPFSNDDIVDNVCNDTFLHAKCIGN